MAYISEPSIKVLWVKSGNCCANCKTALTEVLSESEQPIGQMAHIAGEKEAAARYDASMTDKIRNGYSNLILLCPTCHNIIDRDATKYTVERLSSMKSEHEGSIQKAIKEASLSVSFFELEATLRHLIENATGDESTSLTVIPPKDKIEKNQLSTTVEQYLQIGLLQSSQVEEYLNKNADMDYARKLRSVFIEKYEALKTDNYESNALFYALWDAASGDHSEATYKSAGLAVLSYYFYLCEVFER